MHWWDLNLDQPDVKTSFFITLFKEQLVSYQQKGKKNSVCLLKSRCIVLGRPGSADTTDLSLGVGCGIQQKKKKNKQLSYSRHISSCPNSSRFQKSSHVI